MEFDLAALREEAADSLDILFDDAFPEVLAEGTVEELVGLVREACVHFHTQGVTTLLLDGSPQYLFYHLGCAAENWRRLLLHLRTREAALPPASDNIPLLGAVAASYWDLARDLCRVSASQRGEDEYEDEFAWAHLLQEFIALPDGGTFSQDLLRQHERVLAESQADRLEVFRALLAGDRSRFLTALERVLHQHEEETEAQAVRLGTSPDQFVAYRFIWFEGLALLRLAERRGMRIDEPLRYCPPLARIPMKMEYDGDWALPFKDDPA
ncbi:immunity 49 family protein [Pyxidicoccus fallax]|uniref:Immunity 49 family protein n=1 Tax=Pyxidicoccus fallax TaxID=394095 RepID=A0A848LIY0_9BACT|nr:Imm49 family immunity protein [Pyxidicoccus fallax]NMO17679.1 immunity 49 family protein [Pyxidicoccus fallax]NPC78632.1 immunity 49 family protein [Pyxidicoccus fallax]